VADVTTIARISEARRALAAASTLEDVMQIRDKAEALRVYVKAAAAGLEAANAAAEIKLRAERKAGEMLALMEKNKGGRPSEKTPVIATEVFPPPLSDLGVTENQSKRWQREAKVPEEEFEAYIESCCYECKEVTQAGLLKIANGSHVSLNSGENEWYTPPEYIEAAREAMGSIDLDPASCETAQANVLAKRYFDIEDNGLDKPWTGNVWLNPPYGKEVIGLFTEKVVGEAERFQQAVVLVNNATDTAWFHDLASVASAACFIRGRIRFLDKSGKPANTPVQGQVAVYVGPNVDAFREAFASFGAVVLFAGESNAR
jgi:ParB family chromosome partitioning protein